MSQPSDIVDEVIDGRRSVYGQPFDTFARIAQMWSAQLDTEVHAWQVPLLLISVKLIRTGEAPAYSDNSDDIEGYLAIFREIMGEDMVHARSVSEYLAELNRRKNETHPFEPSSRVPTVCRWCNRLEQRHV